MAKGAWAAAMLGLGTLVLACDDGGNGSRDARSDDDHDSSVDESDAATPSATCDPSEPPSRIGIASAPLNATGALALSAGPQLLGEGLPLTLMPQQGWEAGLRWKGDRMFMLADPGFWDIQAAGPAVWHSASSLIVWQVRAGDVDADGDLDLLVHTTDMNAIPESSDPPNPLLSRLALWERTDQGIAERAEVTRAPGLVLSMPHALGDIDQDGDLDVIGLEDGAPVAYVHDGAFGFDRVMLGTPAPEVAGTGVLTLDYADRNQDGFGDLLIIQGNFTGNQLENEMFVLLSDGAGGFEAPGPVTKGETPLVPYGPDGIGLAIMDVTGDGLADVLAQDDQSGAGDPHMRLYVSASPNSLAEPIEVAGLGFELADVDEDGATDIVTTRDDRLVALLSRGDGAFETRELGVSMTAPNVVDYVVDPGHGSAPAVVHVLYKLRSCPECDASGKARCLFDTGLECLSDADCTEGRCAAHVCVP